MTVSQVCAFCPPPCRKTTCGGSSPHFNALMSPDSTRATAGSGPVCADLFGVLGQQREFVEVQPVRRRRFPPRLDITHRRNSGAIRAALCQRELHEYDGVRTEGIDDPHRWGCGLAGHGAARGDVFRRSAAAGNDRHVADDDARRQRRRRVRRRRRRRDGCVCGPGAHRAGRRGAAHGGRDLGGGLTNTSATRRTSGDVRRTARRHGRTIRSRDWRPARQASTGGSDTGRQWSNTS